MTPKIKRKREIRMNEALRLEFKGEVDTFAQKLRAYTDGALNKKSYKGFSGGFGSYAQRDGARHMLRLRMTGGRLTRQRLGFLADCVEKYGISRLKLTTCQTIQLHDLEPQALVEIMAAALDHDIVTRGGGGDYPRNVMASPLSGVEPGEYFDVLPAAEAAGEYLLGQIKGLHLPRKLKVAFSNSPHNATHATFRDMGFVARPDGTFDVYCCGGLGPNPKLGVLVDSAVAQEDILLDLSAMLKTFVQHGNYENRAKARTRYLQDTLGADGLREVFLKNREAAQAEGCPKAVLRPVTVTKPSGGTLSDPRALPQKQPGLYAVSYQPMGGLLAPELPRKLYDLTAGMPGAEWRVGPAETLYCVNLTADEAWQVLDATGDGARTLFERSVACIGATVCQQGVRDSQTALHAMVRAAREAGFADGVLPQVRLSGCPSSCGAHQAAALGFQGGVKLVDGKPQPAFTLTVGGQPAGEDRRLGEVAGAILEADLPAFIVALGRLVEAGGGTYADWYPAHTREFEALVAKYTA